MRNDYWVWYPSYEEPPQGNTDLHFLSSVRSCKSMILSGLLNSWVLKWDRYAMGNSYGKQLSDTCYEGKTVPQTPVGFLSYINGRIDLTSIFQRKDVSKRFRSVRGVSFPINLLEYSGGFLEKSFPYDNITIPHHRSGQEIPFMYNRNWKILFLVVDPTKTGEDASLQQMLLLRILDFLDSYEATDIMKRVVAVHIVVSKADVLESEPDLLGRRNLKMRAVRTREVLHQDYQMVMSRLCLLCEKFHLYQPRCIPFSIGTFSEDESSRTFVFDPVDSVSLSFLIAMQAPFFPPKNLFASIILDSRRRKLLELYPIGIPL